jgi:predicted PurR-regulated permease PerM
VILGVSYPLAVIAGILDLIPSAGATIVSIVALAAWARAAADVSPRGTRRRGGTSGTPRR